MLTLQELKQVVGNREERRKVPSARYLRENDVAVVKQRLIDGADNDLTSGNKGDGFNYPTMRNLSLGISITY